MWIMRNMKLNIPKAVIRKYPTQQKIVDAMRLDGLRVSQQTLSNWLRGVTKPHPMVFKAVRDWMKENGGNQ